MRKITAIKKTKHENRLKQIAIGGVLILIAFTSVLGYSFQNAGGNSNSVLRYNNLEFKFENNYWVLGSAFAFRYNPEETEDFNIGSLNAIEDYQDKPLYIYSEYSEAENEIYRNLYNYVQRIQYACFNDSNIRCNPDWPVKTCEDNFILIREGDFNVSQNENCLFITGSRENLTKISDEALYNIIGVK